MDALTGYAATTLQAAMAATLAAVTTQVGQLNAKLKAAYLTTFGNWAQSVSAGRASNTNPPLPPMAWEVGTSGDGTTGPGSFGPYGDLVVSWAVPVQGSKPVCEMPPIPGVVSHDQGEGRIGNVIAYSGGEFFQVLDGDTTPVGKTIAGTSQDGVAGLFKRLGAAVGLGWYQRIAMLLVLALMATAGIQAQVTVSAIPEPLAVMDALHVRSMGLWSLRACNEGAAVVTVAPERLYMAIASIRPIEAANAVTVLTGAQSRSTASQIVRLATIAGSVAGLVTGFTHTLPQTWSTGIAVGSAALPSIVEIARGQVPSTAPFTGTLLAGPVTLEARGCITRTVYAAKQKNPAPFAGTLQ